MTKVRNQYSAEFKLELIKLIEEQGQKVPDVAGQYNIGKSTLEKWLQRYRAEQSGKPLITGRAYHTRTTRNPATKKRSSSTQTRTRYFK